MNAKRSTLTFVFCIGLISLLFTGCGGGMDDDDALVPNIPPIADAGMDRTVNQGEEVFLSGVGSNDPDGQIVSYLWEQTAGTPVPLIGADLVAARFLAPMTGVREELVFQLTVLDNAGASNSAQLLVTANVPPTADAGPDQFLYASSPVTLTGTAEDVDGLIVDTLWEQTGGTEVALSGQTTQTINFNAPSTTETLNFRYTVTDNDGAKHSDSVNVYLSRIIFSDSFDDPSSRENWDFIYETSNTPDWRVIDGELVQFQNVNNGAFRESYHLGTFAHLSNPAFNGSNAFRFSVDITPQSNANGFIDGNSVGIMFPYSGNNGPYYRLTMNSRYGFTRLEKWNGFLFSTLAVNARGYIDDQTMTVTVEVNEDTFIVLVNDEPLFASTDIDISPGTVALFSQDQVGFDNVVVSDNSPQPLIALAAPLAHSIALTPRDGNMLVAEAVVINKPIGSSVTFSLNGAAEIPSDGESGNLFWVNFDGASNGEHEVAAILRDATGKELSRDTNILVGVGGNYIIALGDSITNGTGDKDPTNNSSIDGRIVANQGFAASLSDAWSNTTGLPQIVFNEGIPGDRSLQLDQRIDSILERHPGADTILLLIGTNDALGNVTDEFYRTNLTNIADFASTVADRFFIARILPLYTSTGVLDTRNSRIIAYNNIISLIVSQRVNVLPGPDLYNGFWGQYNSLYDPDGIHPNDAGYQEIARLWRFAF